MSSRSNKSNDGKRNKLAALVATALAAPLVVSSLSAGIQPGDSGALQSRGGPVQPVAEKTDKDIIIVSKSAKKKKKAIRKRKRRDIIIKR